MNSASNAPSFLTPDFEAVPVELRELSQWVTWKAEYRDGAAKPTKVPYCATTGARASTTDPSTWAAFEDARRAYESGAFTGVGFVFTPDSGLVGVDLDGCRDPETGAIQPWASKIIGDLDCWTEVSVSRTGVHLIARGTLPPGGRRKGPIEMYVEGRYFTLTGRPPDGIARPIAYRTVELGALHARVFAVKNDPLVETALDSSRSPSFSASVSPDDDALLDKARSAKNGQKFRSLFDDGDVSQYPSPSEADLALCNLLAFWTNGDGDRVDRLFRRSALLRSKWDEVHGDATYGHRTIEVALQAHAVPDKSSKSTGTAPLALVAPDAPPVIEITDDLPLLLRQAVQALGELRDPQIFQRGSILVTPMFPPSARRRGKRKRPHPRLHELRRGQLRELLRRNRRWFREDRSGAMRAVLVPAALLEALVDQGGWGLPEVSGFSAVPVLHPDGSTSVGDGYDAETGVIVHLHEAFPDIPASPTEDQVADALAALLDPIAEFPFATTKPARVAAIAAILTAVARPAIEGCVPLIAIRSTTPGSGKGLLADVISIIAIGMNAPVSPTSADNEEMRKTLMAIALEGVPFVLFDNVTGEFGCAALAAALTAETFQDRILGASRRACAPLRPVWTCTGNNICFTHDLGRRVLPIDFEPLSDQHGNREWKYPRLREHVEQERGRLACAALTILRAYIQAGCPPHGKPALGSFEEWDALIRGAVIHFTGDDPLEGRDTMIGEIDADVDRLGVLLNEWHARFGTKAQTLASVVLVAQTDAVLRDALGAFDSKYEGSALHVVPIANALKSVLGRPIRNRRLVRAPRTVNGSVAYMVSVVGGEPGGSPSGPPTAAA